MGKTIKLFLLDNKSTERIKCSVQGTLCVAFKIKRDDLDKPLDEDDKKLLNQSGIYFLFGETSDKSAKEIVYHACLLFLPRFSSLDRSKYFYLYPASERCLNTL